MNPARFLFAVLAFFVIYAVLVYLPPFQWSLVGTPYDWPFNIGLILLASLGWRLADRLEGRK